MSTQTPFFLSRKEHNLTFFPPLTVYGNNNSSVSCAGICDMKSNNPSSTSAHVDSYESLNCSTDSVFDGHTVTTSHVSSNAFSKTSGGCFATCCLLTSANLSPESKKY